jgi:hypothetical protein
VDGAVDIENIKEYLNTVSAKITGKTFTKDIVASADMKDIKGSLKKVSIGSLLDICTWLNAIYLEKEFTGTGFCWWG